MNILEKVLIDTINNKPTKDLPVEQELEKGLKGLLDDEKFNSISREKHETIIASVLDKLSW